jgi:tensin
LSIESWLKADERNVAVLHCLTGRGRTSTVLAAFLCWTGEAGFNDVNVALEYIARCKRVAVEALTIPSQVRYISYFANMLDGVRPSQPPLMLKRIIMSDAPKVCNLLILFVFGAQCLLIQHNVLHRAFRSNS